MLNVQTRLQSSRAHDVAGLRQALAYPESLVGEFRGIPENKVGITWCPPCPIMTAFELDHHAALLLSDQLP
jgi:hypothetical protein